jgi:hypothetical protein
MKIYSIPLFVSIFGLAGCLASAPPVLTPSGKPTNFAGPILGKAAMSNARYVLIEKSIADGKYKVVDMGSNRQAITNARQERIAFSSDLTSYAPDFTEYSFQTYTDSGNYNEQTVVMRCDSVPEKTEKYGPCNSEFAGVFVPMGVTKAFVAGRMTNAAKASWENPKSNLLREVSSPLWALRQAGVLERLNELATSK